MLTRRGNWFLPFSGTLREREQGTNSIIASKPHGSIRLKVTKTEPEAVVRKPAVFLFPEHVPVQLLR